jgi:uncharacterized protein (TIGR00288 family)
MTEQKSKNEQQIGVLIDFENVGVTAIQSLFDKLSENGKIILKRAYADWSKANNSRDQIFKLGIEPVLAFRSPTGRKNTSDIRLTIDAIDLLYTSSIDTFVIVSSDSDFVPLVNKLRSLGKNVYVAGDKTKATDTLKIACNEYFDLDQKDSSQPANIEIEKAAKPKPVSPKPKMKSSSVSKPQIEIEVGQQIDLSWSKRAPQKGESIPGPTAAAEAVKILKLENLKSSAYKTIQGILDASPLLTEHWQRDKNTMVRK